MNTALIEIVLAVVKEKYTSERVFYQEQLGFTEEEWSCFKRGEQQLHYPQFKIISALFTDYEWMLVQKMMRMSEVGLEKGQSAVVQYMNLKYQIARQWLQHGLATLEWHQMEGNDKSNAHRSNMMLLQVIADYGVWGYSDVLELRLPGVMRQQVEGDQRKLLEWFDDQMEQQ